MVRNSIGASSIGGSSVGSVGSDYAKSDGGE
jgi:hypothetical protein